MAFGKIYVDEVIDSNGDTLDISELTSNEATNAAKGYLSAADKAKLDGVAAGAEVNAVTSVNGSTGAVTVQGFSGDYADLTNKPTIPTIDPNTVIDSGYVATDENFTTSDHSKLDGIETAATADQTKADIDALNIDADTLDGQHGSYYTGYTDTAVAGLVDSSPATLDTLNELAAALGDDPNFATTTANSIGTKLSKSGGQMTGNITFSGSQTVDGRDLSADGAKLDGVAAGAQVNAVTSVNGATGAVTVQGFSGAYADLTGKPTLGTAAATASSAYATSTQGATADSALQPGDANPVMVSAVGDLPSASSNHGAVIHVHNEGAMYFAHSGSWHKLQNESSAFSGSYSNLSNKPTIIANTFSTSAPSSPSTGDLWVDTTDTPPVLKSYNGTAWVAVGSAGSSTSAPVINGVTLSEVDSSGDRFTSESFTVAVNMLDDGSPISQKGVKGKVTATFEQFPVSNAITAGTVSTSQTSEGNTTKDSSTNLTHNESTGAVCFNVVDTSTNSVRCFMWYPEGSGSSYDDMLENSGKDLLAYTSVDNDFYGTGEYKQGLAGVQNRLGTWVNIMGRHNNVQAAFEVSGLLSGNPVRSNKNEVSTDAYIYVSNGRSFTRYDLNRQNGISLFLGGVPYSGGGGPYFMETLSDRIFIVSQSSTSGSLWTKELTDAASANLSNGNYIYQDNNQSGFNRYDITGCIFHKGKVLISKGINGGGIYAFTPGTSSPTISGIPAAPSGYQNTYGAIWEDPLGNLILRTTHFSTDWSTQAAFYYSSNNNGATWVANHYPYDSNFNYEYWTPDLYLYGRRQKSKRIKGSGLSATVTKQVYTIRSQTLTVTNGADLSSLNVGDIVRPPGETDPLKYSKIDSISSNGNGTTNVVVNGFNDFAVGDVIESTASTGSATSTRFLVINAQGAITTHQVSDPGFVTQGPGASHTITFPATFPTGNSPDDELPSGTTIQVDVQAVNSEASDTYASNTLTPS